MPLERSGQVVERHGMPGITEISHEYTNQSRAPRSEAAGENVGPIAERARSFEHALASLHRGASPWREGARHRRSRYPSHSRHIIGRDASGRNVIRVILFLRGEIVVPQVRQLPL